MPPPPRFIGHLDAECFYVSAERARHDFLGGLRHCQELRDEGRGRRHRHADLRGPEALPPGVYVKRDFRWYEVLSRQMQDAVRDLSPRVENHSIDEFYFDATPPRGLDPAAYAVKIRDRNLEAVGVPVTVGIARTRTLAKLISDTGKPFGAVAVLDRAAEEAVLDRLAVTEVTGIAGRREWRLIPWGIVTRLDLARADRRLVRSLLTAAGEALWWELNGDPVLPSGERRPLQKVLSRGGSFGEATADPVILYAWLIRNLERLVEELHYHEVKAGHLAVWVGYKDVRAGEGRASLEVPSDCIDDLLDAARPCLRRAWVSRALAARMHLFAERLTPKSPAQIGLFEPAGERAEAVEAMKREVNGRHGRFVLRSTATLPLAEVDADWANQCDVCNVRGKMCF